MRNPLNILMIIAAILAAGFPAGAEHFCDGPPNMTLLTGESVTASGDQSEGVPEAYWWYVTPPRASVPSKPTGSGPQQSITVDVPGLWSIDLAAYYDHQSVGGGLWISETCVTIQVSSVASAVGLGALQVATDEELEINGHASAWAVGVTPQVEWQVDGQALGTCNGGAPPTSPANLDCTIPANWLSTGWHTAGLLLTDPSSGQSSLSTANFEVIEVVPLSVDFSWFPVDPDPGVWIHFIAVTNPPVSESDLSQVAWDFGDGNIHTNSICPPFLGSCFEWQNNYTGDGWYNVTVTVHTLDETASKTYEIEVGDPVPPPVASFNPSPSAPVIYQNTTLSFDGTCTGDCDWSWSFGDGEVSSTTNPTHQWDVPDTYTVSLTVSNPSGADSTSLPLQVGSCWSPSSPSQTGSCYGGQVTLTAAAGSAWRWSTGATARIVPAPVAGSYWANINDGTGCWGHTPTTVVLNNCGDPGGDTNLDAGTDAADLGALVAELTDGDGDTVIGAGGGDLTAPGGDVTGDFRLRTDDLLTVLVELFQ